MQKKSEKVNNILYKKKKTGTIVFISVIFAAALLFGGVWGYNKIMHGLYPVEYSDYVEKYAKENNISEYLVYSVIKTESNFNTAARSEVGARGLMQIMEETFDWIKYKIGDDKAVYYDMYSAKKNIEYGCWLLGYLYKEFGNIECVAAAYHAGMTNVKKWLSDRQYSSDGVHLDNIPISSTAYYVEKIKNTMQTYLRLYSGK